jgi:octaprenyl-diphosphate synthase
VLRILSTASAVIAEGEVRQLITSNDITTDEEAYLEVIRSKTAALFAAACRIGAVVADRPLSEAEALGRYGRSLGIAFQLVDDVLDYSARQAELGKTVGDDFREGKVTLPVVLALRAADAGELDFWKRCLEDLDQHDGDLERAIGLMERCDALKQSLRRARRYADEAIRSLGEFQDTPERRALMAVADFCVERAY